MQQFKRDIVLFFFIQFVILFGSLILTRCSDNEYLAATIDKHDFLARSQAPRIILVGGSNLAFGVDSCHLESELEMPAINMALTAPLGVDFIINEVENSVRPGDIIVLSLEFQQLAYDNMTGAAVIRLLAHRLSSIAFISLRMVRPLLDEGLIGVGTLARCGVRGIIARPQAPPYTRDSFNANGDVVAHQQLQIQAGGPFYFDPGPFSEPHFEKTLQTLLDFGTACTEKGASVLYSHPPIPIDVYKRHVDFISKVEKGVGCVASIEVITRADESAVPNSHFFDTPYHLSKIGIRSRTETLVKKIAVHLQANGKD